MLSRYSCGTRRLSDVIDTPHVWNDMWVVVIHSLTTYRLLTAPSISASLAYTALSGRLPATYSCWRCSRFILEGRRCSFEHRQTWRKLVKNNGGIENDYEINMSINGNVCSTNYQRRRVLIWSNYSNYVAIPAVVVIISLYKEIIFSEIGTMKTFISAVNNGWESRIEVPDLCRC